MTRSLTKLQAIVLGAVVLLGLGLGGFGLFWIGSRNPTGVPPLLARWLLPDTFTLRAGFDRIQGVEAGTRVRVKGIEAGEVVAIERPANPQGAVVLVLRLRADLRDFVRRDAVAQIVAEGMVGGKVVEIDPGADGQPAVTDNAFIATRPSSELSDVLADARDAVREIRNAKGSLYKIIHDDDLHAEAVQTLRQGRRTLASLQENSDAIKDLPVVRGYVKDVHKLLVRPECERNRKVFGEADLFESGRAILTAEGRRNLDEAAPWLLGLKHKGSDVVVVAYTPAGADPDSARALTEKQAEVVCNYLVAQHAVQKMGWFSSRRVTPLGCGSEPPPVAEKEKLPERRIEVVVFVPHN